MTDPRAEEGARRFTEMTREILGDRLAGVYLHGSAAMGCFHPAKSDLDYIVVTDGPVPDGVKRAYMDRILALDAEGPAKGIEMSVVARKVCNPFVYPTPFLLHYSRGHTAWYRRDPEDYIRKMNGTDRDLAAHFTVIRRRGIRLWGPPAEQLFGEVPAADYLDSVWNDVADAETEIAEHPLYLILNLPRVLAAAREQAVLSKREGGEWALEHLPEEFHPLICAALREYAGGEAGMYDPELSRRYARYLLGEIAKEMPEKPEKPEN